MVKEITQELIAEMAVVAVVGMAAVRVTTTVAAVDRRMSVG